jgi:hypothetical protein
MRIQYLAIVVMVIAGLWMVPSVGAQAPGDPDAASTNEVITGIVAFDNATVYVGPDFAYRLIGQLPLNGAVTILGRRGDFYYSWNGDQWLEIAYGEGRAWVYARMIRTSVPFNSIPPTGRALPRNRDGRVPEGFDLSANICDAWPGPGEFTLTGDFRAGDVQLTVTYPSFTGANIYNVITVSPSGVMTSFPSDTTTSVIPLSKLPRERGTYLWRVAPYWTDSESRYRWQQVCLLHTAGTFVRP